MRGSIKPMRESQIQKKIIQIIEAAGGYVVKTMATNRNGVPDLLCCMPQFEGQLWAIEVKKPGGKLSPLQEYHIRKIREAGGVAFVAHSVEQFVQLAENRAIAELRQMCFGGNNGQNML